MTCIVRFIDDDGGATAVEYGLIAALIALAAIAGFTGFGNGLGALFDSVENRTSSVLNNAPI